MAGRGPKAAAAPAAEVFTKDYLVSQKGAELIRRLTLAQKTLTAMEQVDHDQLPPGFDILSAQLVHRSILHASSKEVVQLSSCCLVEALRLYVPTPPYSSEQLKAVFRVLVAQLPDLRPREGGEASYERAYHILESLATVQSCCILAELAEEEEGGAHLTSSTSPPHSSLAGGSAGGGGGGGGGGSEAAALITAFFTALLDAVTPSSPKQLVQYAIDCMTSVVLECSAISHETLALLCERLVDGSPVVHPPPASGAAPAATDATAASALAAAVLRGTQEKTAAPVAGLVAHYLSLVAAAAAMRNAGDGKAGAAGGAGAGKRKQKRAAAIDADDEDGGDGSDALLLGAAAGRFGKLEALHSLILALCHSVPAVCDHLLPLLASQCSSDEPEARAASAQILGRVFALPTLVDVGHTTKETSVSGAGAAAGSGAVKLGRKPLALAYSPQFTTWLGRFHDREAGIRAAMCGLARDIVSRHYTAAGADASGLIAPVAEALVARMGRDADDAVRRAAVSCACDIAVHATGELYCGVVDGLLSAVLGRCVDRSLPVRMEAATGAAQVYASRMGGVWERGETHARSALAEAAAELTREEQSAAITASSSKQAPPPVLRSPPLGTFPRPPPDHHSTRAATGLACLPRVPDGVLSAYVTGNEPEVQTRVLQLLDTVLLPDAPALAPASSPTAGGSAAGSSSKGKPGAAGSGSGAATARARHDALRARALVTFYTQLRTTTGTSGAGKLGFWRVQRDRVLVQQAVAELLRARAAVKAAEREASAAHASMLFHAHKAKGSAAAGRGRGKAATSKAAVASDSFEMSPDQAEEEAEEEDAAGAAAVRETEEASTAASTRGAGSTTAGGAMVMAAARARLDRAIVTLAALCPANIPATAASGGAAGGKGSAGGATAVSPVTGIRTLVASVADNRVFDCFATLCDPTTPHHEAALAKRDLLERVGQRVAAADAATGSGSAAGASAATKKKGAAPAPAATAATTGLGAAPATVAEARAMAETVRFLLRRMTQGPLQVGMLPHLIESGVAEALAMGGAAGGGVTPGGAERAAACLELLAHCAALFPHVFVAAVDDSEGLLAGMTEDKMAATAGASSAGAAGGAASGAGEKNVKGLKASGAAAAAAAAKAAQVTASKLLPVTAALVGPQAMVAATSAVSSDDEGSVNPAQLAFTLLASLVCTPASTAALALAPSEGPGAVPAAFAAALVSAASSAAAAAPPSPPATALPPAPPSTVLLNGLSAVTALLVLPALKVFGAIGRSLGHEAVQDLLPPRILQALRTQLLHLATHGTPELAQAATDTACAIFSTGQSLLTALVAERYQQLIVAHASGASAASSVESVSGAKRRRAGSAAGDATDASWPAANAQHQPPDEFFLRLATTMTGRAITAEALVGAATGRAAIQPPAVATAPQLRPSSSGGHSSIQISGGGRASVGSGKLASVLLASIDEGDEDEVASGSGSSTSRSAGSSASAAACRLESVDPLRLASFTDEGGDGCGLPSCSCGAASQGGLSSGNTHLPSLLASAAAVAKHSPLLFAALDGRDIAGFAHAAASGGDRPAAAASSVSSSASSASAGSASGGSSAAGGVPHAIAGGETHPASCFYGRITARILALVTEDHALDGGVARAAAAAAAAAGAADGSVLKKAATTAATAAKPSTSASARRRTGGAGSKIPVDADDDDDDISSTADGSGGYSSDTEDEEDDAPLDLPAHPKGKAAPKSKAGKGVKAGGKAPAVSAPPALKRRRVAGAGASSAASSATGASKASSAGESTCCSGVCGTGYGRESLASPVHHRYQRLLPAVSPIGLVVTLAHRALSATTVGHQRLLVHLLDTLAAIGSGAAQRRGAVVTTASNPAGIATVYHDAHLGDVSAMPLTADAAAGAASSAAGVPVPSMTVPLLASFLRPCLAASARGYTTALAAVCGATLAAGGDRHAPRSWAAIKGVSAGDDEDAGGSSSSKPRAAASSVSTAGSGASSTGTTPRRASAGAASGSRAASGARGVGASSSVSSAASAGAATARSEGRGIGMSDADATAVRMTAALCLLRVAAAYPPRRAGAIVLPSHPDSRCVSTATFLHLAAALTDADADVRDIVMRKAVSYAAGARLPLRYLAAALVATAAETRGPKRRALRDALALAIDAYRRTASALAAAAAATAATNGSSSSSSSSSSSTAAAPAPTTAPLSLNFTPEYAVPFALLVLNHDAGRTPAARAVQAWRQRVKAAAGTGGSSSADAGAAAGADADEPLAYQSAALALLAETFAASTAAGGAGGSASASASSSSSSSSALLSGSLSLTFEIINAIMICDDVWGGTHAARVFASPSASGGAAAPSGDAASYVLHQLGATAFACFKRYVKDQGALAPYPGGIMLPPWLFRRAHRPAAAAASSSSASGSGSGKPAASGGSGGRSGGGKARGVPQSATRV